jgi:geranylgeranyl reductase family protein
MSELAVARDRVWDAVVVGAGPAGSTVALHLARRGRSVLLLDRHSFPRDKVCGDGLVEDALRCLERAELMDRVAARAYALSTCSVFSPRRIEVSVPGRYLTIRRVELDDILRAGAVARGAAFAVGTVSGVHRDGDGLFTVTLEGAPALRSRCVVVASGANPALLKRCGVPVRQQAGVAAALRGYVTSTFEIDRLIVSYDRTITPGYAWIFPLGRGWYNVGCGVFHDSGRATSPDLHAVLESFLRGFPAARQLMEASVSTTRPKGAMIWAGLSAATPVSRDGVLVAGEALGTTLPLTGEGIGKAMESAELAALAADAFLASGNADALVGYAGLVQARLRPKYRGYLTAQRWVAWPRLADFICWRACRSPRYAALLAGIMTEAVDPSRAFSVRGVLASFFG